jgi:uncharacterized RDD family membrane protein YckC
MGEPSNGLGRRDVASWLQGPRQTLEEQGYDFGYKGQRLGLPEAGAGSVAGAGRRLAALTIDWLSSLLVAQLLFRNEADLALETLGVFAVMTIVLVSLTGASFGQRLLGLRVVSVSDGGPVAAWRVAIRTGLLCLVIPAVVWDRDQRGLHDRAAGSVVVRTS